MEKIVINKTNENLPVKLKGIEVQINSRDSKKHVIEVADALKELKRQIKKAGMLNELKRREHYLPPSKARRVKRNESIKQRKRDKRKEEWYRNNSE